MKRVLFAFVVFWLSACQDNTIQPLTDTIPDTIEETQHLRTEFPYRDTARFNDSCSFVVVTDLDSTILVDMRYYGSDNFVGIPIDGYQEPVAILTREAAEALSRINDSLGSLGFRIKIFDAYRPYRAVQHFCHWAEDLSDTLNKGKYYPTIDKNDLFRKGYLSSQSTHCHGSTVDLTLADLRTGWELDMGSRFDFLDEKSHTGYSGLTEIQKENRRILHDIMVWGGFTPVTSEWWHFRLKNEPYNQMFDFPVCSDSAYAQSNYTPHPVL